MITYTSEPDNFKSFFVKIWKFRALIWVFAKRDLQIKYSQTVLGVSWTIFQPLMTLLIYTFFFGYVLGWNTEGIPFVLYVLSGLMGWNLFIHICNNGVNSLLESSHLIKKIYFPKSILPLSKVLMILVESLFSLMLFVPLIIYYEVALSIKVLLLPFVIIFNVLCGICVVFWMTVFSYVKRDVLHVLPFVLNFGIWFSPVFYSASILPERYRFLLEINPLTSVVQMWRWCLFDYGNFNFMWIVNFVWVVLLLLSGIYIYNRKEDNFSDFV